MTEENIVRETQNPELIALENERLRLVKEIKLVAIFGPIATLISMVLWVWLGKYSILFFTLLMFGCGIGTLYLLYRAFFKKKKTFTANFRKSIMSSMIKMYKPEIIYEPTKRIGSSAMEDSLMFPRNANQYYGSNYMSLVNEDFFLECAEMKTFYDDGRKKDSKRWMIFGGTFFSFQINKSFAGYTVIMTERTDWLSQTVQNLSYKTYEKHPVNDPAFEENFNIYTSNPEATSTILSEDFKKALEYLRTRTGCPLTVSFANDRLCFAMKHTSDYFNPALNKSVLDANEIKTHSYRLKTCLEVIETIHFFIKRF